LGPPILIFSVRRRLSLPIVDLFSVGSQREETTLYQHALGLSISYDWNFCLRLSLFHNSDRESNPDPTIVKLEANTDVILNPLVHYFLTRASALSFW